MRKRIRKTLIITGATLGGLLIVIIAAVGFLISTETGLEFILARAPDNIQVQSVKGALLGPFTLRGVTIHTDSAKIHVDQLTAHWSPLALFSGTLDINRLQISGVDVWRHPAVGTEQPTPGLPQLALPIAINIDSLELDNVTIHPVSGDNPFVIRTARLSAKFDNQQLRVRKLEAHGPHFDLSGHASIQPNGDYPVHGEISFALQIPDYAPAQGSLKLSGSLRDLDLTLAIAAPYNTQATLHANVLASPVKLNARLAVNALELHAIHGAWPTVTLHATAHADGSMKNLTYDLQGHLRGDRLGQIEIALNGTYTKQATIIDKLAITRPQGSTYLQAHGRIGDTVNLQWQIESPDLASLYPGAHGSLKGHGHIEGPRQRPRVVAELHGENIRMLLKGQWYAFKQLNLSADIDLSGNKPSSLDVAIADSEVGKIGIKSVDLHGAGTPSDHQFTLDADTSRGNVQLAVHGALSHQRWQFTLRKATLAYPTLAPWQLVGAGHGYVSQTGFALQKTCWTVVKSAARACVQAKRSAGQMTGLFTLKNLAFAYFESFMPPKVAISGHLGVQGKFKVAENRTLPVVHLTLHTSAGKLIATTPVGKDAQPTRQTIVAFAPSKIKLNLDDSGLNLNGGLQLAGQGKRAGLFVQARIPSGTKPLTKRPLTGKVTANIPDIGFIAKFRPTLRNIGGRLEGTLHVNGTLAAPNILGKIALQNGHVTLPKPGLKITGIHFVLQGLSGGGIRVTGKAQSGGGTIAIKGTANLTASPKRADINLHGQAFQVLGNELGTAFISPDLNLTLRDQTISVTGIIKVPKATLTPTEIPQSAVTVSPDQVIIKPGQQKQSVFAKYFNAHIRLVLGDDVHFKGFGLKSDITGVLTIIEKPHQPTIAHGALHLVNGEYRAYGQGLVIEQGTLLFAGPITEPAVDIRAVRHPAENIIVGLSISGTLRQPQFKLFSNPPMTQAQTLSWLVLGRPLNDTSPQQGSALSRLALTLSINQSNKVVQNFGKSLGLDTFSIKTGSGQAGAASNVYKAALVIGEYLSPSLYVSYGIGLFAPVNTVKLEYTLSSRWKLVAQSSSVASGADLIYTLESD